MICLTHRFMRFVNREKWRMVLLITWSQMKLWTINLFSLVYDISGRLVKCFCLCIHRHLWAIFHISNKIGFFLDMICPSPVTLCLSVCVFPWLVPRLLSPGCSPLSHLRRYWSRRQSSLMLTESLSRGKVLRLPRDIYFFRCLVVLSTFPFVSASRRLLVNLSSYLFCWFFFSVTFWKKETYKWII